ncbi:MAG: hypothetical protein CL678_04050 [Bdellovibrionaceae bacterium]|nr:hypothetical protein [Pseudobdellovibrionaceae bacterium]
MRKQAAAKYVAQSLARWSARAAFRAGSRALLAPQLNAIYFDAKRGDIALRVVVAAFYTADRFESPQPHNAAHREALGQFMRCALREYKDGLDSAYAAEMLLSIGQRA